MADDIGFIALPPKGAAKQDDGEGFTKLPAKGISAEDRRAYTEALPGTPEGMKVREGIEGKYGGREAFVQQYDPTGEYLGKNVAPALGIMAATAGTGSVPAIAQGGAAALESAALRKVAVEVLKWLGKGAAAGVGAGGAYELGRKAMSK